MERDPEACATLNMNIEAQAEPDIGCWKVYPHDVRALSAGEVPKIEVVIGGPSCQPFSIAGKRAGRNDERDLMPEFTRIVRDVAPKVFVFENVDGMLRPGFAKYFEYVVLQLTFPAATRSKGEQWRTHRRRLASLKDSNEGLTYHVRYAKLNAADYGVAQARRRVFVVGFRADIGVEFRFPPPTHSRDRLIYDQWISKSYWDRHEILAPPTPSWLEASIRMLRGKGEPPSMPWQTVRDCFLGLPEPTGEECTSFAQHVLRSGARSYVGHTGSEHDAPSKTIKAGDHGVPGGENSLRLASQGIRYYTVREMARIQAFPDAWRFAGRWNSTTRQLGNAVPVELGTVVASAVRDQLRKACGVPS